VQRSGEDGRGLSITDTTRKPSGLQMEKRMPLFRKPAHADATGDAIPFFHQGKYHIFSLTPPLGTGVYPDRLRTTWHHVVSDNLVDWEDLGTALSPGGPDEPDADGCWTGAVIFAEGQFQAFYTGYNIRAAFPQTICHAISPDGVTWTKNRTNPCLVPLLERYERLDWRDPYVFYNDEDGCYWMILSARTKSGPVMRRGCVVLYRSRDLQSWEHYGPIYEPKDTNCPECPELYRMGGMWHLSYSRFSEFGGTIYRISDNPFGGWRRPEQDRIGSRRFYAAKSMENDAGERFYIGWTADRAQDSDKGEWYWGGIFAVPHAVTPSATGPGLDITLPAAIARTFRDPIAWCYEPGEGHSAASGNSIDVRSAGTLAYGFLRFSAARFLFSCRIRPRDCRDHFGLLIKSDRDIARCLLLAIEPAAQRASLVNYPLPVDPFWEASVASMAAAASPGPDGFRVAEAVFEVVDGGAIDIEVLVDEGLVEVFAGRKVALNYRWYGAADYELGVLVQDGCAS
jgi:beta-fructofuranosidase